MPHSPLPSPLLDPFVPPAHHHPGWNMNSSLRSEPNIPSHSFSSVWYESGFIDKKPNWCHVMLEGIKSTSMTDGANRNLIGAKKDSKRDGLAADRAGEEPVVRRQGVVQQAKALLKDYPHHTPSMIVIVHVLQVDPELQDRLGRVGAQDHQWILRMELCFQVEQLLLHPTSDRLRESAAARPAV
eukprot:766690-Hanusia_phi.AAC.4